MKRFFKFIMPILASIIMAFCFTGCNQQILDFNFEFKRAYVKIGEEWQDVEIKTWTDYDGEQLQLTLKDGTVMVVHSANCILYNGTLPID